MAKARKVRKVGLVKACKRLVSDSDAKTLDRLVLLLWPLYMVTPVDALPEAFLGPVGLGDDMAVFVRAMILVRVAYKHYRTTPHPHNTQYTTA